MSNKQTLWKYKEFFVFDELEHTAQEGEIELVLDIIEDNPKMASERSMKKFISTLHKRLGHKQNMVVLLKIYDKMIDYESEDMLKPFLLRLISSNPIMLDGSVQDNMTDYMIAIHSKEVLHHVLFGSSLDSKAKASNQLAYSVHTYVSSFKLGDMMSKIKLSMEKFEELYQNIEDQNDIDYDEI